MGTITKVVMKSGTVFEFDEPMSATYKSGWARYEDSNGQYVIDVIKENIDGYGQPGEIEVKRGNVNR